MEKEYLLRTNWTVSKARDSYGYNICSLYDVNKGGKVSSTCGGGYDMRGTVLGSWITREFKEELLQWPKEKVEDHYGLFIREGKVWCNGACGESSMLNIMNTLGYDYKTFPVKKKWDNIFYQFTKRD